MTKLESVEHAIYLHNPRSQVLILSAMSGLLASKNLSRCTRRQTLSDDNECPLWVMCGRRLGKNFLTLLQHWSGAVMCPACLCGGQAAGPNAMRGSGPNQKHAL